MLIIEKLKSQNFSSAENTIAQYLIDHVHEIDQLTTQNLASFTHSSPNSVMRLTKKLGFKGWTDFKHQYQSEWQYLNSHFTSIDANLPFNETDDLMTITHKISQLEQNTIADTAQLVNRQLLSTAQTLLLNAKEIIIFAANTNSLIAKDFVTKMRRIGMSVTISSDYDVSVYEAYNSNQNTCAIIISYTGESESYIQCGEYLKANGAKIISLTNIGDNKIARLSDCNFKITTRERLYSKIGNFTTNTSIIYLLNLIYAAVFAANYQHNLEHLIQIGQEYDSRFTTTAIIEEEGRHPIQNRSNKYKDIEN